MSSTIALLLYRHLYDMEKARTSGETERTADIEYTYSSQQAQAEVTDTTKRRPMQPNAPSRTRHPLWAQLAYGNLLPAALRLSPEPIQRTQNVAPHAHNTVIQRKPKVDLLSTVEEALVESKIASSAYQDALDELVKTAYFAIAKAQPGNVGAITYDSAYTDYGLAEQDKTDPKANNTVDIKVGKAAYKDISILVSTLQHELIHAEQHTKPSVAGKDLASSSFVYGYAKEGTGASSKYIAAAQEVDTHCWEIEHGRETGVSAGYLIDRGTELINYWARLNSASTAYGVTKHSKPRLYRNALKGRVEDAFRILKLRGIDIDQFFVHGKFGLTKP